MKKALLGMIGFIFFFTIILSAMGAQQASASFCGPIGVGDRFHYSDPTPLTLENLQLAQVIAKTGEGLGVPPEGQVIAIATAIVEDRLRNRPEKRDATSVGLFQQQDWWGTEAERTNPVIASRLFYTGVPAVGAAGLLDIEGWQDMPPGDAAQAVQVSAKPDEYGKVMVYAEGIYQTVSGNSAGLCGDGSFENAPLLIGVDGSSKPIHPQLYADAQAMIDQAASEGIVLTVFSGWRSIEQQETLRLVNGCPDVYESSASSCRVPTAIPGQSNHNRGLAIDFRCSGQPLGYGSPCYAWLSNNAARYGLFNTVAGEAWHWSRSGA